MPYAAHNDVVYIWFGFFYNALFCKFYIWNAISIWGSIYIQKRQGTNL